MKQLLFGKKKSDDLFHGWLHNLLVCYLLVQVQKPFILLLVPAVINFPKSTVRFNDLKWSQSSCPNIEKWKFFAERTNVLWLRFKCLSLFLYVYFTLKRSFKTGVKIPVKWIWLKYMTCAWGCLFMNIQAWDVVSWRKKKRFGLVSFYCRLYRNYAVLSLHRVKFAKAVMFCELKASHHRCFFVVIMLINSIFTFILKLKQFMI